MCAPGHCRTLRFQAREGRRQSAPRGLQNTAAPIIGRGHAARGAWSVWTMSACHAVQCRAGAPGHGRVCGPGGGGGARAQGRRGVWRQGTGKTWKMFAA
jgi:hypothetical protein